MQMNFKLKFCSACLQLALNWVPEQIKFKSRNTFWEEEKPWTKHNLKYLLHVRKQMLCILIYVFMPFL